MSTNLKSDADDLESPAAGAALPYQVQPRPLDQAPACPTYAGLAEFHLKRITFDKDGNTRSRQVLRNQRSHINKWVEFNRLNLSSPVGEELGVKCAGVLAEYQSRTGKKKQTISDRKSTVLQLRESLIELRRLGGLPEDFGEAVGALIEMSGGSLYKTALKVGVGYETLKRWIKGASTPLAKSLKLIHRLEDHFGVTRGTLSSKLPEACWARKTVECGATPWRNHQRELMKLQYIPKSLPPHAQREWDEVLLFFSDDDWAEERGMQRNSSWRIRWNTGRCVSGEVKESMVRRFFGYLTLPTVCTDKRMRGQGFGLEQVSLALLSDARLVKAYLQFVKARTVSQSYNSYTKNFALFAVQLLRPETGYLRQLPEYGEKLPRPIPPDGWDSWCEENRRELIKFLDNIGKNKKEKFRKTRDPFAGVRELIAERQHPISALFEVAKKCESLTSILKKGCPIRLASHCRNIFQLRFIGSNPLRVENFSMMTFIPKDFAEFQRVCELYCQPRDRNNSVDFSEVRVETDRASNLYQKPDGSWWLRFDERDFKNEKGDDLEEGVIHAPYDVLVVPSVWPSLRDYVFRHRSVLNGSVKKQIAKYRRKNNLPLLTAEEEMAIERCPYVFRPSLVRLLGVEPGELAEFKGVAQMTTHSLSHNIFRLTQMHLSSHIGFSAHACRHLVATEYIKNRPEGEAVAAAALHNTVPMVKKHYAWVRPADKVKAWNDYHEDLHRRYENGEI